MSTFFRSAAMGLLSRTLQTLLSKYLSDVDVEGVALPSLISSDGHSGWGVRLKHVKLREGAKLMDLPGRPKKKKRHRKKRDRAARKKPPKEEGEGDHEMQDVPLKEDAADSSKAEENTDASPKNSSCDNNTVGEQGTLRTVAESETDADTMTTMNTTATATPPAPPKRWFSWSWSRSSTVDEETPLTTREPVAENGRDLDPPSNSATDVAQQSQSETVDSPTDELAEEEPLAPLDGDTAVEHSNSKEEADVEEDYGEKGDDAYYDYEDDEDEPPMVLRLGENGTIGVLDVRLVGKTIHVLVEDAFLTVEAVPLTREEEDEENKDGTKSADAPKKSRSVKIDPKTVGDRVLAENVIARALFAIPNLFLRDIQVRLVVREEQEVASPTADSAADSEEEKYVENDDPPPRRSELGPDDLIVEFGIEFLSVTEGDDFLLSKFSGEEALDDEDDADSRESGEYSQGQMNTSVSSPYNNNNEYLVKRIRTGRGESGGITMRMFPPGELGLAGIGSANVDSVWARQSWASTTQFCVLRISGFDLQARILLGTKQDIEEDTGVWYVDEYGDYSYGGDLFFGGVDYVAPGPQPELPPISGQPSLGMNSQDKVWFHAGATTYQADANGIQSSTLESSFHRVARGLAPSQCERDHLPCEDCPFCWEERPGVPQTHVLDESTPMPGLVLNVSMRDPLVVNLDRPSLDALGLLVGLFTKKKTDENGAEQPDATTTNEGDESTAADPDMSTRSMSFSRNRQASDGDLDQSQMGSSMRMSVAGHNSLLGIYRHAPSIHDIGDITESFPAYMQPENIQISGLHLSEVQIRIHVMRSTTDERASTTVVSDPLLGSVAQKAKMHDFGLSFCYWDILLKCVTMDRQMLSSPEKAFQDVRLDVGLCKVNEYKGIGRTQIISLGMKQREIDLDDMTVETLMTKDDSNRRSAWPSTAAALLDVPAPLETLVYEARERHGIQLRYFVVQDLEEHECRHARSHAHIRLGLTSVDVPWAIRNQVRTVLSEARMAVLGPPKPNPVAETKPKPTASPYSLMKYRLQTDGGHVRLDPLCDARMPQTQLSGERSSVSGLFFETLLESVNFSYGGAPSASRHALVHGLPLHYLAELPENVRLRVLLFIHDLKPFEVALGLKPEPNSFLRCRAVNRGIVKAAKKQKKSARSSSTRNSMKTANKRREIVSELLKMDNNELEELQRLHARLQRKKAAEKANR